MQLQPPADEIVLDPPPPFGQHRGIVVEQREIVDVAHIGGAQDLGDEMIEAVEVEVGEELARQIADRQTAAALERREQVVAVEIEIDGFLPVRAIDDISISASVEAQAMRRRNAVFRIAWSIEGKYRKMSQRSTWAWRSR